MEKEDSYFERKLRELRRLVTEKTILVIDNFSGSVDRDFTELLELDWRVILVSRQTLSLKCARNLHVSRICEEQQLILLFQYYLGRTLKDAELPSVKRIIAKAAGHTQILELIARQISASHLSMTGALKLMEQNGFSKLGPETVDFEKDRITVSDTVGRILDALFASGHLDRDRKAALKIISLLPVTGMSLHRLSEGLGWSSYQTVNDLQKDGWIMLTEDLVTMHPVIQEAVARWSWDTKELHAAEHLLRYFLKLIQEEVILNEYPRGQRQQAFGKNPGDKTEEKPSAIAATGQQRLTDYLMQARSIIRQCKKIPMLNHTDSYLNLLYAVLLNMPQNNEDYILSEAGYLIRMQGKEGSQKVDARKMFLCEHRNPVTRMRLLHRVTCLYGEQKRYRKAEAVLAQAEKTARQSRNRYVLAQYYNMRSDYQDILLAGAYDAVQPEEKQLLKQLLRSTEKCMHYAKKYMEEDRQYLYIRNLLGLCTILIRSERAVPKEIDRMLEEAKHLILLHTPPRAEVRHQYDMVCAWFFALIGGSLKGAQTFLDSAAELYEAICPSELERIDCLLIPSANIYLELEEYQLAMDTLARAHEICLQYPGVAVYMRRDLELQSYMLDVAVHAGDYRTAGKIIRSMDRTCEEYSFLGISADVPEEIRELAAEQA